MNAKVSRRPNELGEKFQEQVNLLKLSCMNYDSGFGFAAAQIATSLRVFIFDKPTSLLSHIGVRNSIELIDTRLEMKNDISCGLVYHSRSTASKFIGGEFAWDYDNFKYRYIPLCHNSSADRLIRKATYVSLEEWLNQPVCRNINKSSILTRGQVILTVANQDGGAHVDEEINAIYNDFRFPDSPLNEEKMNEISQYKILNTLIHPILRQLGNEFLISLKRAGLLNESAVINWYGFVYELDQMRKSIADRRADIIRRRDELMLKVRSCVSDDEITAIQEMKNMPSPVKEKIIESIYIRRFNEQSVIIDLEHKKIESDEKLLNERKLRYLEFFVP